MTINDQYIYIEEDGVASVSEDFPTRTDLFTIGDGRLEVLCLSIRHNQIGVRGIDSNGKEYDMPQAQLDTYTEGDDVVTYHRAPPR